MTCICTGKPKNSCDSLYCGILFCGGWNGTCNIYEVCLYHVWQNNALLRRPCPNPQDLGVYGTLHGKRDFADVIKDLEMGRMS